MSPVADATWGIPGPAFLVIYVALIAVSAIAVLIARRRITARYEPDLDTLDVLDDYQLAVLAEGPEAGGFTALHDLWRRGVIVARNESVDALDADARHKARNRPLSSATTLVVAGDPPDRLAPIERAVLDAVRQRQDAGIRPHEALADRGVRAESAALARGLEERRVVYPDRAQRAMRACALLFAPVLVLGVARYGAGSAAGRPVTYLVLCMLAVLVLAAAAVVVPPMPRRIRRLLTGAQRTERDRLVDYLNSAEFDGAPHTGDERRLLALYGASLVTPTAALLLAAPEIQGSGGGGGYWGGESDGGGGGGCGGGGGGGGGCGG
jgi:uncharacterized protein (TIGR04222 family)